MTVPPSGEQIEIRHGDQVATLVGVGGGIRTYTIGGRHVLDGYDVTEVCDGARGQQLVPWPNRVKDGIWSFDGKERQLAITEPEQHTAIHGLARWADWQVAGRDDASVTLAIRIHPQPGWDWTFDVATHYALDDGGLRVRTEITNRGDSRAPAAAGAHPYLAVGTPTVDHLDLELPASEWLPTGNQQIPTGTEPVAGTDFDFRSRRRIGQLEIDNAFTGLSRDPDGRARVRLTAPDGRWDLLWVDEAFAWVEIFTGHGLPDPHRRRQGVGIEPMSAPPNALASGEGLTILEPGEACAGEWGIESSLLS